MNIQKGLLLKSTAALDNTIFAGAAIYITECNAGGAVGFIINRSFERSIDELEEFKHSVYFPLYDGGPVDKEHLFFIHRRPDRINDGIQISGAIFYGGNFRQAINGINNKSLSAADIKIFVGYCGWDAGELEAEIAEGSWVIATGTEDYLFSDFVR
jgi:putative transcriptional regulator